MSAGVPKQGQDGKIEPSELAQAAAAVCKYIGYYKFVAPEEVGKETEMDYGCYLYVFENLFKQYFPYLHLDRPEVTRGQYAMTQARGPRNKRVVQADDKQGDLYEYLRDNIEIATSRFAYLDAGLRDGPDHVSWAIGTFNPARTKFVDERGDTQSVSDTNNSWNFHLALLGQGLHAVEDFFAHSTFVEHASAALPPTYRMAQRAVRSEILERRLRKWKPGHAEEKWRELERDTCVVTGYFDGTDTIISLLHLCEELFGWRWEAADQKVDDLREYPYRKLLRETLEFISNPAGVWSRNAEEAKKTHPDSKEINDAAEFLRKPYEEAVGKGLDRLNDGDPATIKFAETLLQHTVLKNAPAGVKEAFLGAANFFGKARGGWNLYKTLKEVAEFIAVPEAFLAKKLIVEPILEQVWRYVSDTVGRMIGSERIGSHSLIAKDGGTELFYDAGMACAGAVHWYIVATLSRHGRSRELEVCRTSMPLEHTNLVYCVRWIDWLELVEYYLAHPLARIQEVSTPTPRDIETSIVYVTKPKDQPKHSDSDPKGMRPSTAKRSSRMSKDSLATLATHFRPHAGKMVPGTGTVEDLGEKFTWRTIADANFPTQDMSDARAKRQINKILSHQEDEAMLVADGINYAFMPGYRLVIPNQRMRIQVPQVKLPAAQRRWWYPVILEQREKTAEVVIGSWYNEDGSLTVNAPAHAHRPVAIPRAEQLHFIEQANALRQELADKYNALVPASNQRSE